MAKSSSSTEHKIEGFAEDLGRILGQARNKADSWLGQRQAIVKQLTQLRDEASKLLRQLGHDAERVVRRGRPLGRKNLVKAVKKTPRRMSKAARAAISAAQKARWAKQKADTRK